MQHKNVDCLIDSKNLAYMHYIYILPDKWLEIIKMLLQF